MIDKNTVQHSEVQFRPTLNKKGWMLVAPDAMMVEFVNFALAMQLPAVDVGATYGTATLAALRAGCSIIATDLDERHLAELRDSAAAQQLQNRLRIAVGRFPNEPELAENSIGAVLLSRILTFLSPEEVRQATKTVYRWLAPGGRAFITADTPFLANFLKFVGEFQRRVAAGDCWPGWIEDTAPYVSVNKEVTAATVHLFTPEVLQREFENAGFTIERAEFLNRTEYPPQFRNDGRESVALVVSKPLEI